MKKWLLLLMLAPVFPGGSINANTVKDMEAKNYYCEYCGRKFPTVRLLTSASCSRHPNGSNKGKHKLYEGNEKSKYTCKYCGREFHTIMVMVGGTCSRHPKGSNKGPHAPAL